MMGRMRTATVGPSEGTLLLRTGVEGRAARLGHALTLRISEWVCTATLDGETPLSVELRAQLPHLEVVAAEGGLKPLSDKDKRQIVENARKTLKTARHPEAVFSSTAVQPAATGWSLLGNLSIGGVIRAIAVDVAVTDGHKVAARTSVVQSHHDLSPYSVMLGAMHVRDQVEVHLEASIPPG